MALVSLVPGIAYLSGRIGAEPIVNADYLLLQELIPSLAGGTSTSQWTMPYATYLVPDWLLYSIALLISPTPATTIALFAALQVGLLAIALRLLSAHFELIHPTKVALGALCLLMTWLIHGDTPIAYLGTSYVHAGTAIGSLLTLALTLSFALNPRRQTTLGLGALSFAMVASDRIFVVWALIPAGSALLGMVVARQRRLPQTLPWFISCGLGTIAALPIPDLLFPTKAVYDLQVGVQLSGAWSRYGILLESLMAFSPLLLPVSVSATIVSIYILIKGTSPFGYQFAPEVRIATATFIVTLIVATIASQMMLVGAVSPTDRYNTAMFVAPTALFPMIALAGAWSSAKRQKAWIGFGAIGSALMLVAIPTACDLTKIDIHRSQRPIECVVKALDQSGSKYGISGYWDAREFELFSNERLKLVESNDLNRPIKINMDLTSIRPNYDFAVFPLKGKTPQLIKSRLFTEAGPPRSTTTCGQWQVFDYGPGGLKLG